MGHSTSRLNQERSKQREASWSCYFTDFLKRKEDIKSITVAAVDRSYGSREGAHIVFKGKPDKTKSLIRRGTISTWVTAIFPALRSVWVGQNRKPIDISQICELINTSEKAFELGLGSYAVF